MEDGGASRAEEADRDVRHEERVQIGTVDVHERATTRRARRRGEHGNGRARKRVVDVDAFELLAVERDGERERARRVCVVNLHFGKGGLGAHDPRVTPLDEHGLRGVAKYDPWRRGAARVCARRNTEATPKERDKRAASRRAADRIDGLDARLRVVNKMKSARWRSCSVRRQLVEDGRKLQAVQRELYHDRGSRCLRRSVRWRELYRIEGALAD